MSKLFKSVLCTGTIAALCLAADGGLDPQMLLKPLAQDWPTFNGDYSGKRFSSLSQINQSNVRKLTVKWILQPQSVGVKSSPLMVDGRLYFQNPDNFLAA